MNYKTQKTLSVFLSLFSAAGTILTAVLVAKETPKAIEKINKLKENKNTRKIDYVKELIPIYWPAGLMCLGTISSTTISSIMSLRTQASLIATSTMLSQGWRKYKNKVKEVLGIEEEKKISNEISHDEYKKDIPEQPSDGRELFYEEHLGFFSCKKEELFAGLADLNQRLHTMDPDPEGTYFWTTLSYLMKDSHAKVYDGNLLQACRNIGWTTDYLCEVYDLKCMWVHPIFTKVIDKTTGVVLYTKLDFFEDPIELHESEISYEDYSARETLAHNAEIDMADYNAYQLFAHNCDDVSADNAVHDLFSLVNSKPNKIGATANIRDDEDDGRRFIPTKTISTQTLYSDEESLPNESDIPTMEGK